MELREAAIVLACVTYLLGTGWLINRLGVSVGSVVGLFAFVVTIVAWLEKRRAEAVMRYATANGFAVDPDGEAFLRQGMTTPCALFTKAGSRKVKNLVRGQRAGQPFAIFDYEFAIDGGKVRSSECYTVCVIEASRLRLPHFFARRRRHDGEELIDFNEDRAFSKAIALRTKDAETDTRRLFTPRVRAVFTDLSPKNLEVEGRENTLFFHYGGRLAIKRLDELVEDTLSVAQTFG